MWEKMNDYWWKKTITTKAGVPRYTYHYKFKSAEPAVVYELVTHRASQLAGYELIGKDLRDSILMLDEHDKLILLPDSKHKNILLKAIIKGIVVTYGKCFSQAKGRRITLGNKIILEKFLSTHNYLINMRNEYVAHGGESEYENCKYILVLPPFKKARKNNINYEMQLTELRQIITGSEFIGDNVRGLLEELCKWVDAKFEKLREKCEFELIGRDKLYSFSQKKGKRVIVTDKDVERLLVGVE